MIGVSELNNTHGKHGTYRRRRGRMRGLCTRDRAESASGCYFDSSGWLGEWVGVAATGFLFLRHVSPL